MFININGSFGLFYGKEIMPGHKKFKAVNKDSLFLTVYSQYGILAFD
jgi:hypothetical protein